MTGPITPDANIQFWQDINPDETDQHLQRIIGTEQEDEPDLDRDLNIDEMYVDTYDEPTLQISARIDDTDTLQVIDIDLSDEKIKELHEQLSDAIDEHLRLPINGMRLVNADDISKEVTTQVDSEGRLYLGKEYADKHVRIIIIEDE